MGGNSRTNVSQFKTANFMQIKLSCFEAGEDTAETKLHLEHCRTFLLKINVKTRKALGIFSIG